MSTLIPRDEMAAFGRLPEACRTEVQERLRVLHRLTAISRGIQTAIAEQAASLGISAKTLRKYYDAFRHSGGDWRSQIDRRAFPDAEGATRVPSAVVELWNKLCEKNNRKCKPAYRELMRLWRAGEPVGMEWPVTDFDTDPPTPTGCTYRNLMRYRPDDFALSAMRDGLGAAMAAHGPQFLSTRVGLWVGSHYVIDDVKRDLELLLLGHGGQTVCPQELGVLDLLSGDRFAVHRRPIFRREDGKQDKVKEREMRFLIASVFRNVGFSQRGTQIVAELGTAAVRPKLAAWLHEQSGGKITHRGPGITGKEQAIAGYWGRGGGNPRHKAALESHHNLIHNEAANLPAPTGHDRNPPEWLHGLQAITGQVLDWMQQLPPERAALFRVPHLEYWQGLSLLAQIDDRIAWRTDHELQGWIDCGHTLVEYCVNLVADEWIGPDEFLALPPIAQQRIIAASDANPILRRPRKLAPREVFVRGAQELTRLHDAQIALMFCDRELGDDLRLPKAKRLTADGDLELQDATVEPETMHFSRELLTPEGSSLRLAERTDYTVALNPFDRSALWVYDLHARFLGTAPRIERTSPLDLAATHHQLGRIAHEKAAFTAPLAERHADAAALIADIQAHNERVRNGTTQADLDAQREAQSRAVDLSTFAPATPASPGDDAGEVLSLDAFLPKPTR